MVAMPIIGHRSLIVKIQDRKACVTMMKISFVFLVGAAIAACSCRAFCPPVQRTRISAASSLLNLSEKSELSDADARLFERFGAPPEKVAADVDINEVLQWVGTYEDLIDKVDRDNKPFDRERAQEEVDKLLLNKETIDKYIQFEKNKPQNAQEMLDAERETLQEPETILIYVFWVLVFPIVTYIQKSGILDGGSGDSSAIQTTFGIIGGDVHTSNTFLSMVHDVSSSSAGIM